MHNWIRRVAHVAGHAHLVQQLLFDCLYETKRVGHCLVDCTNEFGSLASTHGRVTPAICTNTLHTW